MTLLRRKFLQLTAGSVVAPALSSFALAQTYPARPVRLLVPYAPAGPADILARLAAQKLSEQLGNQFYVENVGGAGGNTGMGLGARAAADGYTVLVVPPNIVLNPAMYDKVPYDHYKDFEPVTVAVSAPTVVTIHPSVAAMTLSELVALIKSSGTKFSFASPGIGTPPASHRRAVWPVVRARPRMSLSTARDKRSSRRLQVIPRSRSRRCRPQSRISSKENCERSPSPAGRDTRHCLKCRTRPKLDIRRFRAKVGLRLSFRPERPRR